MAALPALRPPEEEDDDSPIPGSDVVPVSEPDLSHLITEDDEPVDSILCEKQQRLLTGPLYSSWPGPPPKKNGAPRPFMALANVGFFPKPVNPALVPDMLLSVDVEVADDLSKKENRSYFMWRHGKAPNVVIELVSNTRGGELSGRYRRYCRAGVSYYVVYDPLHFLGETVLHTFKLAGDQYEPIEAPRFETLGLALVEWRGEFEGHAETWLRWCTLDGRLIPTGAERAEEERIRAEEERIRADDASKRAEDERKRAEDERKRAEEAEERVRRLEEMLRAAKGKG